MINTKPSHTVVLCHFHNVNAVFTPLHPNCIRDAFLQASVCVPVYAAGLIAHSVLMCMHEAQLKWK